MTKKSYCGELFFRAENDYNIFIVSYLINQKTLGLSKINFDPREPNSLTIS